MGIRCSTLGKRASSALSRALSREYRPIQENAVSSLPPTHHVCRQQHGKENEIMSKDEKLQNSSSLLLNRPCDIEASTCSADPVAKSVADIANFEPSSTVFVWSEIEQISRAFKLFLNDGWIGIAINRAGLILVLTDPIADLCTGVYLWLTGVPEWALVCACCCCMPHFIMYTVFSGWYTTREGNQLETVFREAFNRPPTVLSLLYAEIIVVYTHLRGSPSVSHQCYRKVRMAAELCESLPWSCFQFYMYWRQTYLGIHVLNGYVLPAILAQSIFATWYVWTDIKQFSLLSHNGSRVDYIRALLLLSQSGLPPPSLIKQISTQRCVVSRHSLESLGIEGFRSLGKAIEQSLVIEDLSFIGSKLDSIDFQPGTDWFFGAKGKVAVWHLFFNDILWSRGRLRFLTFWPALTLDPEVWEKVGATGANMSLRTIRNGRDVVWHSSWDETMWCLRILRQSDDTVATDAFLEGLSSGTVERNSIIQACAQLDRYQNMKRLLANDPSLVDNVGLGLLAEATRWNSRQNVQLLIRAKANPDGSTGFGRRPLIVAVTKGDFGVVEDLLQAKASVNIGNDVGWTPLMYAASGVGWQTNAVNEVLVKRLVEAEANVNQLNDYGDNALHFACSDVGRPAIATMLVTARADMTAKNNHGSTPVMLARHTENAQLIAMLIQAESSSLL